MNIIKDVVEVSGKLYNLQHPGNREWIKLQQRLYNNKTGEINLELLLDYCFEHVVFPDNGPQLKLDDISLSDLEVWGALLPDFLRGQFASNSARKVPENQPTGQGTIKNRG